MDKTLFSNILIWTALILIQVLICNSVMLFHVAIAFIFIYVIIRMPMNMNENILLTCAFVSGFVVDIFADTPGVNSLACTLLAILKRPMLFAYIPRDDKTKNIVPSLNTLGFNVYGKYLISMVTAYCLMVFTIEYFNFADVKEIVIMSASSALLTFLILLGVDSLMSRKNG